MTSNRFINRTLEGYLKAIGMRVFMSEKITESEIDLSGIFFMP